MRGPCPHSSVYNVNKTAGSPSPQLESGRCPPLFSTARGGYVIEKATGLQVV
jgi:hypothetical protein